MRTADYYIEQIYKYGWLTGHIKKVMRQQFNEARKEVIRECADRATASLEYPFRENEAFVNKQSILSLLNEVR